MKRFRDIVLVILAGIHLSIIAIFIWSDVVFHYPDSIGRWISIYMDYAGSNRDYSFFAPSVANGLRAFCIVEDSSGKETVYSISTSNGEANFRFDCLVSACMRKPEGMDMFGQSWAAFYLGQQADARKAIIVSQSYQLPSMEAYRKGDRAKWKTIYTGTFVKKHNSK